MRKLAWNGMRKRKKQRNILISAVALSLIFILFSVMAKDSIAKTSRQKRLDAYGTWTGGILGITEAERQALSAQEAVERIGTMEIYGTILLPDGKETGGIGAVDAEMEKLGRIEIRQGRMPQKDNEIAMEERVLKRLGVSFEPGREITIRVQKVGESIFDDPREVTETYSLCGVLKDYSEKWQKKGHNLAVGIVTQRNDPEETHQFFYGEKYRDVSKAEEFSVFQVPFDGSTIVKNEKAYNSSDIGMEDILQNGFLTILLVPASLCIIFYIQLMQFHNRRSVLLTMYGIGASKGQLCSLLLWENVYVLMWAAPMGAILGTGISWLALKGLGLSVAFDVRLVVGAVWMTAGAFFLSTLFLYFSIHKLQIAASFRTQYTVFRRKSYPKIRKVRTLTPFRMMARSRRFMRKRTYLRLGTALFGFLAVMAGAVGSAEFYRQYTRLESSKDADYVWHMGNTEEILATLKDTEEIREIRCYRGERDENWDWHIRISWEGMEKSRYLKKYNRVIENKGMIPSYNIEVLDDLSGEMGEYYRSCAEPETLDAEAFAAGEEVIVVLPSYTEKLGTSWKVTSGELPYVKDLEEEETLRVGDEITVHFSDGQRRSVKVKVGGIIRNFETRERKQQQIADGAGDLIVSRRFMEKEYWMDPEGATDINTQDLINYIYAYADDGNVPEEVFEGLTEERYGTFINAEKERDADGKLKLSFGVLSGGFAVTVFLICVMVLLNGQQMRMKSERRKNGILQSMGMETEVFRRSYLAESILECLLLVAAGSAIVFLVYGAVLYAGTAISSFAGIRELFLHRFPWKVYAVVTGLYVGMYVCIGQSFVKENTKWGLF